MERNAKKEQMIRSYIEAYNCFDIPAMLENLHDDVIFSHIANGNENLKLTGKNRFKEQAEAAATFFSERKQTIKNITFDSNTTATVAIDYKGIVAVDVPDFRLKKGDILTLPGTTVFVFNDTSIVSITDISH